MGQEDLPVEVVRDLFDGVSGLRKIIQEVEIPSFAIGGINADNVLEVLKCGISGVAVISVLVGNRAKDFIEMVNKFLK